MPKYLVEFKHVEETTYTQWVEAETEEDAIRMVEDEPDFDNSTSVDGIELKDFEIIDEKDEQE